MPVYTIKRAAELTGISPDTLRMWERRYGVVSPTRSGGNYRLYDDEALRLLSAMAGLVNAGWSPSQAALQLRTRDLDGEGEAPQRAGDLGDPDSLAAAAVDFDIQAIAQALDAGFALGPYEEVLDGWLLAALQRLGRAWRDGRVTVAEEHFVSAAVQRRLAVLFEATPRPDGAPRVLIGLGPGARHELGVLAFAVAALRAGVDVVYLGADVPTDSWLAAVRDDVPAAVVLSVPLLEDLAGARDVAAALREQHPSLPVLLGGAQQDGLDAGYVRLGHEIIPAVRRLAELLDEPAASLG